MFGLYQFFELNREIIVFAYGLTFFVLGLVVALQSRRYSRLDLARGLYWLAAFGLLHGLHEWGDLFIPIQRAYLSLPVIELLNILQLLMLGASFACLFEFGVALLRPIGRTRWLHGGAIALFLSWMFVIFFVMLPFIPNSLAWHHTANALARYFIGFPGALLAAYGLRQQTFKRIAPLNVPHIVNTLRIAGLALGLYAIFGGLIPPPIAFFPGNVLNIDTFTQVVQVPPLVFRSLIGLILAVTIIRALEVFDLETERLIEAMEQQQILAAERERIGRELHDGAIQMVYTAGLLIESARNLAEPQTPLYERLERAMPVLNDAIRDLRRNLGELRSTPDAKPLREALQQLALDPKFRSLIDLQMDLDLPDSQTLSPTRTDHVLAIVNEALANVIRHARASRVILSARSDPNHLTLSIQDNGLGLPRDPQLGYGLRNMRDRARLLGGEFELTNAGGKGTLVKLLVPWSDKR